jgi:HPt (histidine-containing phosphotransfer) domain-containing protein
LTAAVERWTARAESRVTEQPQEDAAAVEPVGKLTVVSGRFDPPAADRTDERDDLPLPEIEPGPAIDLEQLNQTSMGVPALRTSMLNTFVADVFPRLQRLEEAIGAGEPVAVEAEALRLRRLSATVGATGCARLFAIAEEWAQFHRVDQVARLVPMIVQEVRRGEEFITRLERIIQRDAA